MRKVILLLVLVVLSACSNQKYFSITPSDENFEYEDGRKILVFEDSTTASTINFEGQHNHHLVFFGYFENNGNEIIEIDPAEISYTHFKNWQDLDSSKSLYSRKAYDPELQITAMENAMHSNENEKSALTFLNCLFGATSVVVAVATDDDDDDNDTSYEIADAIGSTIGNQIEIEAAYEMENAELMAQREFWKNEVLRKTTLHPGERIGGLFHFPLYPEVGWIDVSIPFGKKTHKYRFMQKIIKN